MEDRIKQILKESIHETQFIVVVDKTGLAITSIDANTQKRIDPSMETVVAGIGAAVLSLAASTSTVTNQGNFRELIIKNERGTILILDAGESALLIGFLPPNIKYTNSLASLKQAAQKIINLKITPSLPPQPEPKGKTDFFIPDI
ncbi:MAG: roadblock/LC7 domain-containing protein [Promethearchaeota archaeon]